MTTTSKPDKTLFDQKFVLAAVLIGTAYAVLVVAVGSIVGKEAAGVGGVALTAVATGIFKQFENLRFKAITDSDARLVAVPAPSPFLILLVALAFAGAQALFGIIVGILAVAFDLMPTSLLAMLELPKLLDDWRFVAIVVSVTALTFALAAFIAAKAVAAMRYSTVLYAVFLSAVLQIVVPLAPMVVKDPSVFLVAFENGAFAPAAFWLAYLCAALFGAWLARPRLIQQAPTAPALSDPPELSLVQEELAS